MTVPGEPSSKRLGGSNEEPGLETLYLFFYAHVCAHAYAKASVGH